MQTSLSIPSVSEARDPLTFCHYSQGVKIAVAPMYVHEESGEDDDGENRGFVWMYHITIENQTERSLKLKSRYWRIIDGHGHVEEVHGAGVVGEQPVLHPGETYEYASATSLAAPSGFMEGCYDMETPDGGVVQVDIPAFTLDLPNLNPILN